MAVLLRSGLVSSEQQADLEVEIDLNIGDAYAEASPTADMLTMYRVTALGREVLTELRDMQGEFA
jgi:hypothetical protein